MRPESRLSVDVDRKRLVVEKTAADVVAAIAAVNIERYDLEQERGYLKRRIAEEDERLSRA